MSHPLCSVNHHRFGARTCGVAIRQHFDGSKVTMADSNDNYYLFDHRPKKPGRPGSTRKGHQGYTRTDYRLPAAYPVDDIVLFFRRKMVELDVTAEFVANHCGLDPRTFREILNGKHPGKRSTIRLIANAFGYELGLKKVGPPVWEVRPGRGKL